MSTTDHSHEGLVDVPAVAEMLGVNVRHVRRLVNDRRIPVYKWGHLLRFDPAEIRDWLQDHRRGLGPDTRRRR